MLKHLHSYTVRTATFLQFVIINIELELWKDRWATISCGKAHDFGDPEWRVAKLFLLFIGSNFILELFNESDPSLRIVIDQAYLVHYLQTRTIIWRLVGLRIRVEKWCIDLKPGKEIHGILCHKIADGYVISFINVQFNSCSRYKYNIILLHRVNHCMLAYRRESCIEKFHRHKLFTQIPEMCAKFTTSNFIGNVRFVFLYLIWHRKNHR